MSWHLETETLRNYEEGKSDQVGAASVESHLQRCDECRALITVDRDWLETSWQSVLVAVESPTRSPVEKALNVVGVPQHVARLLAVTPSLRPAWLIAVTLVLAIAGFASSVNPTGGSFNLFLAVVPVLPVLGVAVAYGRIGDPAHEIAASSPLDPLRLLLLRTGAVTLVAMALALMVDLLTGGTAPTGVWLIPTLAMAAGTLAIGTRISMGFAAVTMCGIWLTMLGVVATRNEGSIDPAFQSYPLGLFLIVAVVAAVVVVRRRDAFRRGER